MSEETKDSKRQARLLSTEGGEYLIELDDEQYRFKRPKTSHLDRYFSKASNSLVSAGKRFTLDLVHAEDRERWLAAVSERPGISSPVVTEILEDLGFTAPAALING